MGGHHLKTLVFLMMVALISLSVSSQEAEAKVAPGSKAITGVKPKPVDMGLSVKWADVDLGSANNATSGKFMPLDDTDMEAYLGEGWQVPTKAQLKELLDNSNMLIVLNSAGAPSYIQLTSKKNGAKLKFYLPKTAYIIDDEKTVNPITNGRSTMYATAYKYGNSVIIFGNMKLGTQEKNILQNMVKKCNLKSNDPEDWPDELRNELRKQKIYAVDKNFTYMGTYDFVDDAQSGFKTFIRPVYVVTEESDED